VLEGHVAYRDDAGGGAQDEEEGSRREAQGLAPQDPESRQAEQEDEEFGLLLSTGRTLYHYNAATQTRREVGLHAKQSEAFVELHPRDAKKRSIAQGDLVAVTSRRGEVTLRAMVSRQVRPGCVWMPLHFAQARANVLTNDAGDPVTGTAEYKVCAVEIRRLEAASGPELFPGSYYRIR